MIKGKRSRVYMLSAPALDLSFHSDLNAQFGQVVGEVALAFF